MHAVSTNQIADILHFNDKANRIPSQLLIRKIALKQKVIVKAWCILFMPKNWVHVLTTKRLKTLLSLIILNMKMKLDVI